METNEVKKNKIVPIIIMIVGLVLIGSGVTLKVLNKDNSSNKENIKDKDSDVTDRSNDNEVSEELVKELVKLAFVNEDEEEPAKYSPLDGVSGFINEAELSKQVEIIVNYAENNKLSKIGETDNCPTGEGECRAIELDKLVKIINQYALDKDDVLKSDLLKTTEGSSTYYYRFNEKKVEEADETVHNLFAFKLDDEIVLNDSIHMISVGDNDKMDIKNTNKEYHFKKISDSQEYCLYMIRDFSIVDYESGLLD